MGDASAVTVLDEMLAYSFGLLQLLCELLYSLGVFLPHLMYLGFVGPVFLFDGSLQHSHFLLTFGPGRLTYEANAYILDMYVSFISLLNSLQHR